MNLVCSWCRAVIRRIDRTPGPDSYGMCPACFHREMSRDGLTAARDYRDYLDYMENQDAEAGSQADTAASGARGEQARPLPGL